MKKYLRNTIKIILGLTLLFSVVSCLNKDINDWQKEEEADIQAYIDGKGFTDIGYGIYVKFYNREGVTTRDSNVVRGNSFLVNYDGVFLDESVWETTDSTKGASLFPGRYWVYGPVQYRSGRISVVGFDTAIRFFSAGDTGTIVVPSWYAWGDYARVFHVGMKQVIKNDTVNEINKTISFLNRNQFLPGDTVYSGVYWKKPGNPGYELPDTSLYEVPPTMQVSITARYAEEYYNSGLGRQYFPLVKTDSGSFHRKIGDNLKFPFVPAIDSTLLRMKKGEVLEIAGSSGIGYGNVGYRDPQLTVTIVPEYMPLHFRIEVIDVKTSE